ncbi:MAG TPA: chitobiase/beta-hexosaminidase C-terminal domain-containing protein [Verrucomicrobiae bacterium]|jgi:hypothetical protein
MKFYRLSQIVFAVLILTASHAFGESVWTYHSNNARTGANTNEALLTPANVNPKTFGLLRKYPVDGYVYAQPLYVPGVTIPGKGVHNIVFVATANDSVYAFDADGNADPAGGLLWHDDLGEGIDLVQHHEIGERYHNNVFQDMLPQIGITGTPVIDLASGTLYVDAYTRTETAAGPVFHHKLHALNITDGSERAFSPVEVMASVPGTGVGSSNGIVRFDPRRQIQRPALTLAGGILYVGYGSAADTDPYHGWVIGFNASTLQLLTNSVFNTTPDATVKQFGEHAGEGALWMGGDGLCVDVNTNLYFEVANGSFDAAPSLGNGINYGDSFLKLSTTDSRLTVADYFTPFNEAQMQADDADFGSGGALLLPDEVGSPTHPHLIVGGDKSSNIYLADRDHMGRYRQADNSQLVEQIPADVGRMFGTPAYFDHRLYYQGIGGVMKAYVISNAYITPLPDSMTRTSFSGFGTTPSVSANGTHDGIVWTIQSDGAVQHQPAILHAYNATNLAEELYNSSQLPARDNPGNAVKMSVPTVADGKVFVGTQNGLAIFGTGTFLSAPVISPAGGNFNNQVSVTLTENEPDADIYYTLNGTEPTRHSLHYRAPFAVTNSVEIRALAMKPGAVSSPVSGVTFTNTAAVGGGTGLRGEYWATVRAADFTNQAFAVQPAFTRIEPAVDFNWSTHGPNNGSSMTINPEQLAARWSGSVQSQSDGAYEFATVANGGIRFWLNDRLLINDWASHSTSVTNQAMLPLHAQQFYNLRLEYANGASGLVQLLWRRPAGEFEIIPQTQLYPRATPLPTVDLVTPTAGTAFTASASVTVGVETRSAFNQIANVEFFANGQSLGRLSQSLYAPVYALTAIGLAEGHYTLTAVSTDGSGLINTSAPVEIAVAAGSGRPYGMTNRMKIAPFLKLPTTFGAAVPTLLSGTGIFSDTANRTPVTGSIPYQLNAPMWSDGAVESDFMTVPHRGGVVTPDEQLRLRPTSFWKFPDGTVFVKNLDLVVDETHPNAPHRRLETQILVRDENGAVYGATYKWRLDNRDADLVTAGLNEAIAITNATGVSTQTWYYGSPADCLTCHTPGAGYVLGVNTRQLNGKLTYPATGNTDNQIRTLNRLGLFSPAINEASIASFPKLAALTDTKASLEDRARSYLDVNCAQCHRPGGVGSYDARYDTPLADQHIINAQAAVTLGLKDARIIKAGTVYQSVLYQRLTSSVPTVKMPPLAHNRVDAGAAQVISEWIKDLPAKNGD